MSLIAKEIYGWVVACDLCESVGALCDRDWREMGGDEHGQPIHLCYSCRKVAVWCESHKRYHRPDENHRRACGACGGLFTAKVELQLEHCPSCRPRMPVPVQQPASSATWAAPMRLLQRLHLI